MTGSAAAYEKCPYSSSKTKPFSSLFLYFDNRASSRRESMPNWSLKPCSSSQHEHGCE